MPEGSGTLDDGAVIGPMPRGKRAGAAAQAPSSPSVPSSLSPAIGHAVPTPQSTPQPRSANASAWRSAGLLFTFAFVALLGIYRETVYDLIDGWSRTGTFAHGYIILPASLWLVWRLRDRLASVTPRPQALALLPLVACGVMWLVGESAGVHAPVQYAFVAMIPCLVWAVFGNEVTRRILFPLAFLFFAVPAGDFLMPTLMDHTADFTVAALRLSGVPVFREGNYFTIPSGNWSVVEACSGLRYLIASVTLGCLFAYLNYRSLWRRAAFIVAAILVPIVANWLRAYMIVMLAHLSSNKLATGVDHLVYGWLFFGIVMLLLFWVGNFWRDDDLPEPERASTDSMAGPQPPVSSMQPSLASTNGLRAFGIIAAAALVIASPWPALANWLEGVADAPHPGAIVLGPVDGWTAGGPAFTTFVPHYRRPRSLLDQSFESGQGKVALFVAYYSGQVNNGKLVTYDNDVVVVSDKFWGAVARRAKTVTVAGQPLAVVETEIKGDGGHGDERLLAWRWYWINGRLTTSDYVAKAWNALDKLTGRGDDSAVIVVTTPMAEQGDAKARATLESFVAATEPQIAARLAAIHDQARQ